VKQTRRSLNINRSNNKPIDHVTVAVACSVIATSATDTRVCVLCADRVAHVGEMSSA